MKTDPTKEHISPNLIVGHVKHYEVIYCFMRKIIRWPLKWQRLRFG